MTTLEIPGYFDNFLRLGNIVQTLMLQIPQHKSLSIPIYIRALINRDSSIKCRDISICRDIERPERATHIASCLFESFDTR